MVPRASGSTRDSSAQRGAARDLRVVVLHRRHLRRSGEPGEGAAQPLPYSSAAGTLSRQAYRPVVTSSRRPLSRIPTSETGSRLRAHEYQKGSSACRENQMFLAAVRFFVVVRNPHVKRRRRPSVIEPCGSKLPTPRTRGPRRIAPPAGLPTRRASIHGKLPIPRIQS